jgi:drug/metabolite transporter (DMT)-like permease
MNRARASGIFLGFLGVLVIILSEGNSLSTASSSFFGDILSLGAALSWSIYSVVGRKLAPQCTPMGLTAISTAFGTALLLPPMYFVESPRPPSTGQVWVAVLALSLGSTCVAYALWNKVLSEEEASKTGIALFLIPVVTAAFSVIFLSESLTLPMLFGTALVFSGIIISERVGAKWK